MSLRERELQHQLFLAYKGSLADLSAHVCQRNVNGIWKTAKEKLKHEEKFTEHINDVIREFKEKATMRKAPMLNGFTQSFTMSADKVFHSRSEGIPSEGVKDQYADGKAARTWSMFIGDSNQRTQNYKDFLIGWLRKHGCKRVLDAACGTGVDSMMLVEEGFNMVSVDASDKMLKYALKARWEKRKDHKYDEWVIEEANWETLPRDIQSFGQGALFDAVICLGNSFAHLLDEFGDQRMQKMCLRNFAECLKPGGLLFIDHRNYDAMIEGSAPPAHSIYYNCKHPVDIKTSVLVVSGKPELVALDYCVDTDGGEERSEFRLCYYPHKLTTFTTMLDEAFDNRAKHHIFADFKPIEQVPVPGFYIHVMEKAK